MAARGLSYGDYLQVDRLLSCQAPESLRLGAPAHDEMLFIIVHQAYELWFRQILHELDRVQADFSASAVADEHLGRVVASLARIHEILKLLVGQLDVLETMTPAGFLEFRDLLTPASGFQSVQFRLIEARLGLNEARRIRIDDQSMRERLAPGDRDRLDADHSPSLLAQLDAWLARTPFVALGDYNFRESYRAAVVAALRRDAGQIGSDPDLPEPRRQEDAAIIEKALARFQALFEPDAAQASWRMSAPAIEAALFISLYRDMPVLQLPFRLLQALMDIDESLTLWRLRHALMVERMIGVRPGTGGSSGHGYLKATAEKHRIFIDLFHLSTYLLSQRDLPPLPETLRARMGFSYGAA
jgi:tryptophan 2,3-dioxygenase